MIFLQLEKMRQKYSELVYLIVLLGCDNTLSSSSVCCFGSPWSEPLLPPSLCQHTSLWMRSEPVIGTDLDGRKSVFLDHRQCCWESASSWSLIMAFTYRVDGFSLIRILAQPRESCVNCGCNTNRKIHNQNTCNNKSWMLALLKSNYEVYISL